MLRRLSRAAHAAWLGLLALAIQAAVPALVAGELTIAADTGNSFSLCVFGATHGHPSETPSPPGDKEGIGACPICIALNGAQAFTAPSIASLPLPKLNEIDVTTPRPSAPRDLFVTAGYRSRAPPLG